MFGVTYGFNHQFNKQFMLGASLGVDYSTAAIKDNEYRSGTSTFTNKIALIGGYYF